MSALFDITQNTLGPGLGPGNARIDGVPGELVTVTVQDQTVQEVQISLVWTPPNDEDAFFNLAANPSDIKEATFTPTANALNASGSYLIHVVTDASNPARRDEAELVFAIATPNAGLIIPALNEPGNPLASLVTPNAPGAANNVPFLGPGRNVPGSPIANINFAAWWKALSDLTLTVDSGGGGGGTGLQAQYDVVNTIDVTAARPVLLRAAAGVASPLEVQVDASPVLLVNADGKIALTSTSGQDIDIVVAGGSDVISITGGDVDIDASTGELGLDDQGSWGGTLSQAGDRTLDLTGGGELYENITSIIGALNAVGNAVGSGGSLQSAYVGGQSVAMAAATGNVVWNATDGVAFQIQKGATNVFEMDIAGRVLIDPTSGQDFILNTLGTGDVSINTLGTGALNLNGAVNVNVDAAGGELTLDDVGNWGGTLSQTGDRTLTLTGAGELYNGVTSVLGGLNAAAQSMQETYNIAGLLSLDVDGGNPLKFDSATPHFLGAGLFQIARNTGSNEATVLIAPDTPADSGNAGTTLVLFAANGSDQTTGGTGQSGTDAGGLQFGTLPAGFGSAASGAGAAAGPGGNAVGVVIGLAAGGAGGAGSGSDAAGQGGEGPSFLIDGTSGNGGVGGAGTASVPGANGGTGGAFNLFMGGAGAGGAGSATQAAGDGGNAQDFTVALGAGGAAGAANGGAGGDGGDAASFVLSTALGGVGSGGGTTGQSGHIDWVPALGANPGAVRILNRSPLRFHGPGLGTYTAIRQNADPAAIGELRLPVVPPTDDQILAATTGGATAQLEWVTPSGGGGGGLVFTAVQTAAYTAVADDLVLADPVTTGDFPVHSPASPTKDDKFGVKKSVAGGVVTVDFATTGGSTVDGGQTSLTISANYGARIFQYNGTEWSEVPS